MQQNNTSQYARENAMMHSDWDESKFNNTKGNVLVVATYGSFFSYFEYSNLCTLKELGYQLYGAANYDDDDHVENAALLDSVDLVRCNIPFARSPFAISNVKGLVMLVKLMRVKKFSLIETHNPVVSVYSRLAALITATKPVIYNSHGFFFYKGCPLSNRIIYKTVERMLAHITDVTISINKEDYNAALKMKNRYKSYYIHGVGVDLDLIRNKVMSSSLSKTDFGVDADTKLICSVGELNRNKNHTIVLDVLSQLISRGMKVEYLLCGVGSEKDGLLEKARLLNIEDKVHFLGQRNDAEKILSLCDLYIHPSYKEGLGKAIMEAMACGLPVVATINGGPKDLIQHERGGFLIRPDDVEAICEYSFKLLNDESLCKRFGAYNIEAVKEFSSSVVNQEMLNIYEDVLNNA